jgi:3D (Asp-Asp-Asp) domain-containing protein
MQTTVHCRQLRVALSAFVIALGIVACAERPPELPTVASGPTPTPARRQRFEATAYTVEGRTASGRRTRQGIVAADPRVLPLGSRIRVTNAGAYSGDYEVADTDREIKGREIDIYIENGAEARRFGRRAVEVEVLQLGER